jgi:hypothetical protein
MVTYGWMYPEQLFKTIEAMISVEFYLAYTQHFEI